MLAYRAPRWLPGGNLQTIWAATRARRHVGAPPQFVRERWSTPDGDFIDVDHLAPAPAGTRIAGFSSSDCNQECVSWPTFQK